MHIVIDQTSSDPIYRQIVRQVKAAVAHRTLRPGDQLPTVRDLAIELLVNPNTVQRAYRELALEHVIHSRHGLGAFVTEVRSTLTAEERHRRMNAAADVLIVEGINSGLSVREIGDIFHARLHTFQKKDHAHG